LQRDIDERLKRMTRPRRPARCRADRPLRHPRRRGPAGACGKDTGTVRFDDGDFTVVADLPKRVEWDQERLAQIASQHRRLRRRPGRVHRHRKLNVSERKYAALPEAWRRGFEPARTVRTGALKVVLEACEPGQ
jgi:hypothetical protein